MDITHNPPNLDITGVGKPQVPEPAVREFPAVDEAEKPIKPAQISRRDVDEMVEALQELTQTLNTSMNFTVNETTKGIVVEIVDKETDDVIRQIPPEELVAIQEKMMDLTGFLLNNEA